MSADLLYYQLPGHGDYKIVETTRRGLTPERLKVVMTDPISHLPRRLAWSDAETGEVVFDQIGPGPWHLTVYDHLGEFPPEVMVRPATLDGALP